jgi:hypothetical protein
MDRTGDHSVKRNKPGTEIQVQQDHIHTWNLRKFISYKLRIKW